MSRRAGPSARPKRAGEEFLRTHQADNLEPASKKLRFDARNPSQLVAEADEDIDADDAAVLELDSIGKGPGTKRSAVNLDGYDSDSENDNFDARAADKARQKKRAQKAEESDEDMFASEEEAGAGDEDDPDVQKKKKKTVKFMDADKIEGQVFGSRAGANVFDLKDEKGQTQDVKEISDDEDDSESGGDEGRDAIGDDEDELELGAGAKKKHAPRIDAFNMTAEGEEGRFDETGNFVRKADPNAMHDTWLEGVSKKEMKKAQEAEEKREEERRSKAMERDAILTSDLLSTLISHLHPGETILELLARLNKDRPKQKPKWQKNKKRNKNSDSMDVDKEAKEEDPAETKRKESVESITGAADELLARGQDQIYDTERELLMRQFQRETGDAWSVPGGQDDEDEELDETSQWEYRWADARDGGESHGPYDVPTMRSWNDAGYFGEGVEYRKIGTSDWISETVFG
ncbi:hypothetical protein BT63DRAFT_428232 [Microthyrium microscopicum]|uniref:GYF domain-containing protein n=1 Tax=Microthyrium microscopicum TaxID=703497 RepID=A0A6A6U2E2_9PEZI|nr:hypothetical protein BT63DRAFT_428232 [Microthyrium microscopicum]